MVTTMLSAEASDISSKPYLVQIKLLKLSGFDVPADASTKSARKVSAFCQFQSSKFSALDCANYYGSDTFLCVEGPEEAFWKSGCTGKRMNDEAFIPMEAAPGEELEIDVKVGLMFWSKSASKDSQHEESDMHKDKLYLIGQGVYKLTIDSIALKDETRVALTPVSKVVSLGKSSSSTVKGIISQTKFLPEFGMDLSIEVMSRGLEVEIDNDGERVVPQVPSVNVLQDDAANEESDEENDSSSSVNAGDDNEEHVMADKDEKESKVSEIDQVVEDENEEGIASQP